MNKLLYTLLFFVSMLTITSCSENEETSTEYDGWQSKNEAYFNHQYEKVKAYKAIADSTDKWDLIKTYTKNPGTEGAKADYVLVHKLAHYTEMEKTVQGKRTGENPNYTDSVRFHVRGNLIASASYNYPSQSFDNIGLLFDASWAGDYNLKTMMPRQRALNSLPDGLVTAIQKMTIGDRWEICVPYQLGFGTSDVTYSVTIPAFSTLVYDITLQNFAPRTEKMPAIQ